MRIEINVPDGEVGHWKVESFSVSEDDIKLHNIRAMFHPGQRVMEAGKYKRLMRGGQVVMSNTPSEISDHLHFIYKAKEGGDILINGLGLGVALKETLTSNKVNSVTVIEKSEEVISLVSNSYNDPRVEVIHADAFDWKPPKGKRYNVVWHDIWDNICADNLSEMGILHRKYGKRADWQGSWCRELCQRYR